MAIQGLREIELREKKREEKRQARKAGTEERKAKAEPRKVTKKWKGKDWYVILAPDMFDGKIVGETPATDPKSVVGRNVQVNLADISGDRNKYFVKLNFKINGISEGKASTVFNGMETTRDYIYRVVRKRAQKVELIKELETADNWKLQLTVVTILNRNTEAAVKKKVREQVSRILDSNAKKSKMNEMVSRILSTSMQKEIKKKVTKTYPVRFTEVSKIEVMKAPKE